MRTIDDLLANNARFVEDFPAGHLDGRVFGDLDGQPFAGEGGECLKELRRISGRSANASGS